MDAGILTSMARRKKITVEIEPELLKMAQKVTKSGVTDTVRVGLKKIARSEAYARLLALEGKVHLTYDIDELREDRD